MATTGAEIKTNSIVAGGLTVKVRAKPLALMAISCGLSVCGMGALSPVSILPWSTKTAAFIYVYSILIVISAIVTACLASKSKPFTLFHLFYSRPTPKSLLDTPVPFPNPKYTLFPIKISIFHPTDTVSKSPDPVILWVLEETSKP